MTEHKLPALRGPLSHAEIAAKMATGHSVFSPSGAEMTMTCEESLYLNAIAEDRQTYEAAEGTVGHSVGETWGKQGERPDELIGDIVEIRGFEIEITEEMLAYIEDYINLCNQAAEGADYYVFEMHVDTSHLTPIPGQGGTADFAAFRWQHMTIIDLKYGKEPVFAFYEDEDGIKRPNKQLAVYASGVFREWDWLYNFQTIEIIISQPRLPIAETRITLSRAELIEFEDYARERWAATWKPRGQLTRTPSLKGCRWCAVRGSCPAAYLFLADMNDDFEDWDAVDAGDVVIEGTYSVVEMQDAERFILDDLEPSPFPNLVAPVGLSTEAMEKLLRYRKLADNFFNAIEAELLHRAISLEQDLKYWKLVEGRTLRRLVDDEEHVISELEGKGLKRADLFIRKLRSPAQIEEVLHTKLKMKKADAKRWLENSGLTVKPPGTKTLALATDSRKQLPKDGDVFVDWDNQEDEDDI